MKHDNMEVIKEKCCGLELGQIVTISPCASKYNDKSYKATYIGGVKFGYFKDLNPVFYIEETKTTCAGYESWWTPNDIDNETMKENIKKEGEAIKAIISLFKD